MPSGSQRRNGYIAKQSPSSKMHIYKKDSRNAEERMSNTAWEFTGSFTEEVRFEFSYADMKIADICSGRQRGTG